jgi:protein-S-isoprenylcysteine O-methyltransferase Ste14
MISDLTGLAMITGGCILHQTARDRLAGLADFGLITLPNRYVTNGVYRLRHPAYIGAILMIAGAGILVFGWSGAALVIPAWPFYADRIYREERIRSAAQATFGKDQGHDRPRPVRPRAA